MVAEPKLYTAKVMHKRFFPKENAFCYGVYYLALPLPAPAIPGFLAGFCARDVGLRDGSDPTPWARSIFADYDLDDKIEHVFLVTMPRVLGYVFNPVSFYMGFDSDGLLRAVLCEVHNTFGEQHSYLCAHPDHAPITDDDWLEAKKIFHVSPFLERNGHYKFRFNFKGDKLGVWIDYYDSSGRKQLATSLTGNFSPLDRRSLNQAFWRHPLVALRAIYLIHWQALRLLAKGIRYIPKPEQKGDKVSATRNLEKM